MRTFGRRRPQICMTWLAFASIHTSAAAFTWELPASAQCLLGTAADKPPAHAACQPSSAGACASCVAFSVTSAARAAVAAALQTDASTISLSPQDFFFCKSLGRQEERSCSSGMSVAAGMQAFAEGHAQGQYLVTERCLPYVADRTSAGIATSFGIRDLPQGFKGGSGSSNGGGSSNDGGSSSAALLPLLGMGGFGGTCQYMCDQVRPGKANLGARLLPCSRLCNSSKSALQDTPVPNFLQLSAAHTPVCVIRALTLLSLLLIMLPQYCVAARNPRPLHLII